MKGMQQNMEKSRKSHGDKKLITGAVVLLVISAILFSLTTEQGSNLIKIYKTK